MIVGWIPELNPFQTLPRGCLDLPPNLSFAMGMLLSISGNPDPRLNDLAELRDFEDSKNFRLFALFRLVYAVWDGEQADLRYAHRAVGGYTPIKWPFLGKRNYIGGVERLTLSEITRSSTKVSFTAEFRIKLCRTLDYLQARLTFHRAPWAHVRMHYAIFRDRRYRIEFTGSNIPSQRSLVDWTVAGEHQMLKNDSRQMKAFLTAGSCTDAPLRPNSSRREGVIA